MDVRPGIDKPSLEKDSKSLCLDENRGKLSITEQVLLIRGPSLKMVVCNHLEQAKHGGCLEFVSTVQSKVPVQYSHV